MDFEKAIRPLGRFTPMLEKVPQAVRDAVFDIRISVDKPVLLCCGDRILFLREDGDTAQYFSQNQCDSDTRGRGGDLFAAVRVFRLQSHGGDSRRIRLRRPRVAGGHRRYGGDRKGRHQNGARRDESFCAYPAREARLCRGGCCATA